MGEGGGEYFLPSGSCSMDQLIVPTGEEENTHKSAVRVTFRCQLDWATG